MHSLRWRSALVVTLIFARGGYLHAQPHGRPPPVAPTGGTVLRITYVQGYHGRYVQRTTQTIEGAQPGRSVTSVTRSTMDFETVAVHPDGTADEQMRVAEMDVTGEGLPPAIRATLSHGVTGATYAYTQDARGRIVSRRPVTGVSDEMRSVVDGVTQSVDQMSPVLPVGPIALGGSWHEQKTLHIAPGTAMGMDMNVEVTYTLRELGPERPGGVHPAVIGVAMTLGTPAGTSLQGMAVQGHGTTTGEMTLDLWHGCVLHSHSTGTMSMHVAIPGSTLDIVTHIENTLDGTPSRGP